MTTVGSEAAASSTRFEYEVGSSPARLGAPGSEALLTRAITLGRVAAHSVLVGYTDLNAASKKIECLERRLRRSADWHVPGARVQFTIRSEKLETALDAVADALEECDEGQDLMLLDPSSQ